MGFFHSEVKERAIKTCSTVQFRNEVQDAINVNLSVNFLTIKAI